MQITGSEVTSVDLGLREPVRMAGIAPIEQVTVIFVRIETSEGKNAWGCAVAHPDLSGERPQDALQACQDCAQIVPDLHPTNLEYSLSELEAASQSSTAARCAFDLAFHDLLGLAADMPLFRLLGGYRQKIQTSATVPVASVLESVELAQARARAGFRMLKIKGGLDPEEDVRRVRAIDRALPDLVLRLDADGGYTVQEALDVARVLGDRLEMLEQPTPADDVEALSQVTALSPVPILADQCATGPASALELSARNAAHGLSVKLATCGG